jgi:hypothetical protein
MDTMESARPRGRPGNAFPLFIVRPAAPKIAERADGGGSALPVQVRVSFRQARSVRFCGLGQWSWR